MSVGNGRAVGVVKWFNEKKGYGFIVPEGGGPDVMVHALQLPRDKNGIPVSLTIGDRVTFIAEEKTKGLRAFDLALA